VFWWRATLCSFAILRAGTGRFRCRFTGLPSASLWWRGCSAPLVTNCRAARRVLPGSSSISGLAILILVALRINWRLFDPPPPFEASWFGQWLDLAARLTHLALYGLLIAVPVVGVLVQFARGDALPIFGIVDIASPWVRDRAFAKSLKEVHETLANL
jgi:cytochrome b561-like protein